LERGPPAGGPQCLLRPKKGMVQSSVPGQRAFSYLAVAWFLASLTVILAKSFDAQHLSGWSVWLICSVTQSGSAHWVFIPLIIFLLVLLTDPLVAWPVRWRQVLRLFLALVVALPAFALVNERWVKPTWNVPRPAHRALADAGYIADLQSFYGLAPADRHRALAPLEDPAVARQAAQRLHIDPRILAQWVHEVSSTFPSGHAWNAFLALSFFILVTARRPTRRATLLSVVVVAWACGVAWSRVLLSVHRPVDVIAGATLGIVCGLAVGPLLRLGSRSRHEA